MWVSQILVYKTNVFMLNYLDSIVFYILVSLTVIFSGLWIFSSKREHLLSILLSLEFMSLGIYFMLIMLLGVEDLFYSLIYITFAACEGALGLSILVMMSRTHGGDYFKTFNIFD